MKGKEGTSSITRKCAKQNRNHPMHLHGYKYWILAQGHGWFGKKKYLRKNKLDFSNPLRRDTASAGMCRELPSVSSQLITLTEGYGLVTDNPGAWAFHCQLQFERGQKY
jgi:FtsP/CotA-like multicopper oxidase with cupredoxin domain